MKVLVIGNGSREHAIAWKLAQSDMVNEVLTAPGNAGTHLVGRNVAIGAGDIEALAEFVQGNGVNFSVVGPEAPLAMGIVDCFERRGLAVFGPTAAAARIESSKTFAKRLMQDYGVPTAACRAFSDYDEATAYVEVCDIPVVIKADGLAEGKGVRVAATREEALAALRSFMVAHEFGDAGSSVLVEEYMEGQEVSVFAFVDGEYVSSMVAACDYKRVGDGDTGVNTGGMGSYSPPAGHHWNDDVEALVRRSIMQPVVDALVEMGCPYRGALYLGMMLTDEGPKVVEFNCRLGDPETQVILPRLRTDLAEVMLATSEGRLAEVEIEWDKRSCVGVVMASGGYPGKYATGYAVSGIDDVGEGAMVFQAGTKLADGGNEVRTNGGRVLTVAALGDTLEEAHQLAYYNIKHIRFEGGFYRRDIAAF